MPRISSEAIVLLTRPVGDADLVVVLLTEAVGKIAGSARNARKSRRRFGGALEPLTLGRANWSETEARELVRLESFEVSRSFASRQSELAWFYMFAYLVEVADTFARDREPDEKFFRLLRAAAEDSESGVRPGALRRWFEAWTLRLQGLLPDLDHCARCGSGMAARGAVLILEGEALCEGCARAAPASGGTIRLSAREAEWLRKALTCRASRMPEPDRAAGLDRLLQGLLVGFTGKPFRSARFLQEA